MDEREGRIARKLEAQAAKLPSDVFLWVAGLAVLGSLAFQLLDTPKRTGLMGMLVGSGRSDR